MQNVRSLISIVQLGSGGVQTIGGLSKATTRGVNSLKAIVNSESGVQFSKLPQNVQNYLKELNQKIQKITGGVVRPKWFDDLPIALQSEIGAENLNSASGQYFKNNPRSVPVWEELYKSRNKLRLRKDILKELEFLICN